MRGIRRAIACLVALALGGCGLVSPRMEPGTEPNLSAFLVTRIVGHVKCELGRAILAEIRSDKDDAALNRRKRRYAWLDDWAGTLTLTLQVNEKTDVAPGLTYTNPLQTFVLGAGGTGSAEATRSQQIDYTFDIRKDFLSADFRRNNPPDARCREEDGHVQIEGDLQIRDWLDSSLLPYSLPGFVDQQPPSALTDQITFVLTFGGNVTPTWTLVRFTVNPSGPFFAVTRSRTNEALIALGPAKTGSDGVKKPSPDVIEFRNIALIGSTLNFVVRNAQ